MSLLSLLLSLSGLAAAPPTSRVSGRAALLLLLEGVAVCVARQQSQTRPTEPLPGNETYMVRPLTIQLTVLSLSLSVFLSFFSLVLSDKH